MGPRLALPTTSKLTGSLCVESLEIKQATFNARQYHNKSYPNKPLYACVISQRPVLVWVLDCAVFHLVTAALGSTSTPSLLGQSHTWTADCGEDH